VSDADLRTLYAGCRAFLLPGEEDFGISTVEALASGKPVIALARGGALETVPAFGGVLYAEASEAGLDRALADFDGVEAQIRAEDLQTWAAQFSEAQFQEKMRRILEPSAAVPAGRSS